MSARLEGARKWLRLAFACLAVVAGGLPAQAQAQPEAAAVAAAVHRPAREEAASVCAAVTSRPWLGLAPRALTAPALRRAAVAAERAQGPPRPLFLAHRALLR